MKCNYNEVNYRPLDRVTFCLLVKIVVSPLKQLMLISDLPICMRQGENLIKKLPAVPSQNESLRLTFRT